jgi:hypothetical protein
VIALKNLPLLATIGLLGAFLLAAAYWWLAEDSPGPDQQAPAAYAKRGLFHDMTAESGVHFSYRNGEEAGHYSILESVGGGIALLDFDGDGLLDIFVTGGGYFDRTDQEYKKDPKRPPRILGYPCKLYRNMGGFRFKDVTKEVGLDRIAFYTHGAAVADYDRDGWPDLLVTGYGRVALVRNVGDGAGGRRFVEVTEEVGLAGKDAGPLSRPFWATSAAWGDLDGDGYPDLYVCQYVDWSWENNPSCAGYSPAIPRDICPPKQFDARPHALFHNQGGRQFTEVGKEAGLRTRRKKGDYDLLTHLDEEATAALHAGDREWDFGKGLGVLLVDTDGDGRPDIYVANDTTDKFLYLNRSRPGSIRVEEAGVATGVARDDQGRANGSMGLDAGDFEENGRPALLVTNYEDELHGLYRPLSFRKRLRYEYGSHGAGIASLGRHYVGFGTGFLDLDNDGWLDVFITNGHVIRHPTRSPVRQRPILMRNTGKAGGWAVPRLVNISDQGGPYFQSVHQGRGAAIGDLDNDGRPDLVVSHLNEPVAILRNTADTSNHWLGVQLEGRDHADLVGARLTLEVEGRKLTRFARGGGSYLSSGDPRHLFGLGSANKVGRLTVVWPSGQEQHWDGLATDRYWKLRAGEKEAQEWPPQSKKGSGPLISD